MFILKNLNAENILTVAKYQKLKGGTFVDNQKTSQKSHKAERGSHSAEKSGNLLLRNACKKLAHKHRFEHEPSGL